MPKSAILQSLLWSTNTFLAARSRWMICETVRTGSSMILLYFLLPSRNRRCTPCYATAWHGVAWQDARNCILDPSQGSRAIEKLDLSSHRPLQLNLWYELYDDAESKLRNTEATARYCLLLFITRVWFIAYLSTPRSILRKRVFDLFLRSSRGWSTVYRKKIDRWFLISNRIHVFL